MGFRQRAYAFSNEEKEEICAGLAKKTGVWRQREKKKKSCLKNGS